MAGQTHASEPIVHLLGREIDLRAPATLAGLAALLAAAAIVIAWISEAFGWKPCELCLWQRVPYYFGLPIAAAPLLFGLTPARAFYAAAALVFLIGVGLGGYHSLVEFGVLEGLESCGADTLSRAGSLEAFMAETEGEVMAFCGARTPYLFGLTMSNLNVLASAGIAGLLAFAAFRSLPGRRSGAD